MRFLFERRPGLSVRSDNVLGLLNLLSLENLDKLSLGHRAVGIGHSLPEGEVLLSPQDSVLEEDVGEGGPGLVLELGEDDAPLDVAGLLPGLVLVQQCDEVQLGLVVGGELLA